MFLRPVDTDVVVNLSDGTILHQFQIYCMNK